MFHGPHSLHRQEAMTLTEEAREAAEVPGIEDVCITTNGTLLPEYAKDLKTAGVRRVNISLDTLDKEKYSYITRRNSLDAALAGIEAAVSAGFDKIKINAVLIGGFNDDEIPALAELTKRYPADVRFIELMPMHDGGEFGPDAYIPGQKVLDLLPELEEVSQDGGVARLYRLPGSYGNIGLINPLSRHFCGTCNRIRITADGQIKPCLHREAEYSITGMNEEQMVEQIRLAIGQKPEWYGELSAEARSHAGRNMNQIGG